MYVGVLFNHFLYLRVVPEMTLQANHELLTLTLPQGWLTQHPLGKEIIAQESQWQSYVHWPLEVH